MAHSTYGYSQKLTFQGRRGGNTSRSKAYHPLAVTTCRLNLNAQEASVYACELTVEVSPGDYQRIIQHGWFGFDSELCAKQTGPDFHEMEPFILTLTLHPDWLAFLDMQKLRTAQQVGDYLLSLEGLDLTEVSYDELDEVGLSGLWTDRPFPSPQKTVSQPPATNRRVCALLDADNWFLLKVCQSTPQGTAEVRTFYDYIEWHDIITTDHSDDLFTHTLSEFLQASPITDRVYQDLHQTLQAIAPPGTMATITHLSQTLLQSIPALLRQDPSAGGPLAKAFGAVMERSLHHQFTTAIQHGTLLPPHWSTQAGEGPQDGDEGDDDDGAIASAVATSLEQLLQQNSWPQPEWNTRVRVKEPSLVERAIAFFEAEDWPLEYLNADDVDETPVLRLLASGKNGSWTCLMPIQQQAAQVLFLSVFDQCVLPQQRTAMAQRLMDINYGLTYGNFELDSHDGEVRFRTSLNFKGVDLTVTPLRPLLRNVVYPNLATMDQYLPSCSSLSAPLES